MAKDKELKTYVAELEVTSSEGTQSIRYFDKAWTLAMSLPVPVEVKFIKFARID